MPILAIVTFSLFFLVLSPSVLAQDEEEDAQIGIRVEGNIPLIEVGKDTVINITFEDRGSFNWTQLMKSFPYLYMKVVWPYMFGPWVKEWLGYHSIDFYPEVKGNISGWYAWMEPSEIVGSTAGTSAKLKLHVRVDERTQSNAAVIRIKCVRRGITGEPIAVSYSEIAVTARAYHYIDVVPLESKKEVSPGSTVTIPVEVKNLGNFVDTFHISVVGENGVVGLASDQILVLNPGESQRIYIQATAPITLFDIGTPKNLKILAYSIHEPDNVFTGEIALINKGIYLPFLIILIVIIGTIVALLYIYRGSLSNVKISFETEKKEIVEKEEEITEPVERAEEKKSIEFTPKVENPSLQKKRTEKDELISRILREQDKQKRKFKKY
ncbi:MAG: hypothetical protein J7K13_03160 [Thermoplasmata archaeon]|nr:hypothetical protein [Thermoplasmata archaeon]